MTDNLIQLRPIHTAYFFDMRDLSVNEVRGDIDMTETEGDDWIAFRERDQAEQFALVYRAVNLALKKHNLIS